MRLPSDFSYDLAERRLDQPPRFEEVLARAQTIRRRRQRRRAALGAGIAAIAALGASQFLHPGSGRPQLSQQPTTSFTPVAPTLPTAARVDQRLPPDVRRLLKRPVVHPWAAGGGADGSVAVLWRSCFRSGGCRFVAVTSDFYDTLSSYVLDATTPGFAPVSDGWLFLEANVAKRITADGGLTTMRWIDWPGVIPGQQVLTLDGEGIVSYDASRGLVSLLPAERSWRSAYQTPQGRLVVTERRKASWRLASTTDLDTWATFDVDTSRRIDYIALAGSGDTVAAAAFTTVEPAGGEAFSAVLTVWLSHDGGRTWDTVRGAGLDESRLADHPQSPSGVAVDRSGVTYLTTSTGLVLIDRGGNAMLTPLSDADRLPFAVGDGACISVGSDHDPLMCTEDGGRSWTERPIPGFVSGS